MMARSSSTALAASVLLGCTGPPTVPRAPGSVPAVHLVVGDPRGVVALDVEDARVDRKEFGARLAEDRADLESIWKQGKLRAPLPAVDFASRVVVAFAENEFCNDGRLTSVTTTSSGEIIPETERTAEVCESMGFTFSTARIYVMSLPRRILPPGNYVVRQGSKLSKALTVQGRVQDTGPVRIAAQPVALPSQEPIPPGAHPRRGRVISLEAPPEGFPRADSAGVWVRDDAIWLPTPSAVDAADTEHLLACDDRECLRGFVRAWCEAPECPANGVLLITERPLRRHGAWPTRESDWDALMQEMTQDPVLSGILRRPEAPGRSGTLPTYPHPPPVRIGWLGNHFTGITFEQALGGTVGVFLRDGAAVSGMDVRLGFRWAPNASATSGLQWDIREGAVGEAWGVDIRGRALWELDGVGESRRWQTVGLALAADNPLGESSGTSHVRLPSLLGFVLPEVGFMFSSDAATSFYTAHGFPVSVLFSQRFAAEARPSFTLRFASGREPGPDALVSFSLSLMHR